MSDKLYISWDKLEKDTLVLAEKLAGNVDKDTQLVCVSRGGLFIGGILSYALGLKDVYCISLESYSKEENGGNEEVVSRTPFLPTTLYDPYDNAPAGRSRSFLVVDDINDTSKTFQYIQYQFARFETSFEFATTYHKIRDNNLTPDYLGKELPADCWVVFPWDSM